MFYPLLVCAAFSTLAYASPTTTIQPLKERAPAATATECPPVTFSTEIWSFPVITHPTSFPFTKLSAYTASPDISHGPGTVKVFQQPTECTDGGATFSFTFSINDGDASGTPVVSESWSLHSEDSYNTFDVTCINTMPGSILTCGGTSASGDSKETFTLAAEHSESPLTVEVLSGTMPSPQPSPNPTGDVSSSKPTSKTTETPGAAALQTADLRMAGAALGAVAVLAGAVGL